MPDGDSSSYMEAGTDTSYMDVNLEDIPPPVLLPAGSEHCVEIDEVKLVPEKSYTQIIFRVPGRDNVPKIRHMIFYPKRDGQGGYLDDADKVNNKLRSIKKFMDAFEIFKDEEKVPNLWIGKRCHVVVDIENQPPFEPRNTIKSFSGKR